MALDLSQFRNLDPNNIGAWPPLAKGGVIVLVCAAVLGLGYWFDTKDQWVQVEQVRQIEGQLKADFEAKQAKAVNLEAYRQQMTEMEESFGTMLRQLPSKTEVADLLVDITQTGLASGLEFELFKPSSDVPKDFYAELPIAVRVVGAYHSFGEFVSGVAALPRIVTLHDIAIELAPKAPGTLIMQANAKTYRYLDEEEVAVARKAQGAKKR
jgi:type IV pilus assembly protein PilO